ncbi:MAG: YraN family protein [Rhodocyclales bacterium]|nr:YraN family protein [Rhodocyclales bacterium]
MTAKQAAGAAGERRAAEFLAARGLQVLGRNFRVRGGEIDLVCRDRGCVVFVEVRLRTGSGYGGAAASITAAKQAKVILAARHWLARHGDAPCRFDCVLIQDGRLEWIKDAFSAA